MNLYRRYFSLATLKYWKKVLKFDYQIYWYWILFEDIIKKDKQNYVEFEEYKIIFCISMISLSLDNWTENLEYLQAWQLLFSTVFI